MDKRIDKVKKIRQFLISQIAQLSGEQLNTIPTGYNNNIIWNLIHLMAIQQNLCYRRLGQLTIIPDEYVTPYLTNTKPNRILKTNEIDKVCKMFIATIDNLQEDYQKKIFCDNTGTPNIYKVYDIDMQDIGDALEILLYHEGYHVGQILRLKKLIE